MFRQRRELISFLAPVPRFAFAVEESSPETRLTGRYDLSSRYRMIEGQSAAGGDFFVQNDLGQRVFKIDGKTLRGRGTLVFRDITGVEQCKVQFCSLRFSESRVIEGPDGRQLAVVHREMMSPLRDRFTVSFAGNELHEIRGNVLDHEYQIGGIATVSRKWFRVRDSYGVEAAPGFDHAVALAVTVVIDQMTGDLR